LAAGSLWAGLGASWLVLVLVPLLLLLLFLLLFLSLCPDTVYAWLADVCVALRCVYTVSRGRAVCVLSRGVGRS
jgi:hypothetical protein